MKQINDLVYFVILIAINVSTYFLIVEILRLLDSVTDKLRMQLCKHMAVNAILLHYYDRSRREGVRLSLLAEIEQDISINSQELSVIIGNCLENAFESCARTDPTAERTASLMAKPMGSGLTIVIDNTFDGRAVPEKDVYLSSKRDHGRTGVGMASVKLIVKKYGGFVSFETSGSIYMTSIRLGGRAVTEGVDAVV